MGKGGVWIPHSTRSTSYVQNSDDDEDEWEPDSCQFEVTVKCTHQHIIHWMPITTHVWMNLNRINIQFHLGLTHLKEVDR